MREEWKRQARQDYQELCDRELLKIQLLEAEAWEHWERANGGPQIREGTEAHETREKQRRGVSQWKCLELVLRCSVQRRRLLGLELPAVRRQTAEGRPSVGGGGSVERPATTTSDRSGED